MAHMQNGSSNGSASANGSESANGAAPPKSYKFMMIADLDKRSLDSSPGDKKLKFKSYMYWGEITEQKEGNEKYKINFSAENKITGSLNKAGRGLELSELIFFGERLLTMDDRTGIVYEIFVDGMMNEKEDEEVSLHSFIGYFGCRHQLGPKASLGLRGLWILSDSRKSGKGKKLEWATVKHNKLYVGGHGTEFYEDGKVVSETAMQVCTIDRSGFVERHNWKRNFNKIRKVLGAEFPGGYVTHEAVHWSSILRKWVFLPRRISHMPFDPDTDNSIGNHLMVFADEYFDEIQVIEPNTQFANAKGRGYSSFKFIPRTRDTRILAIKTEEDENGSQRTYITVLHIDGTVLLDDMPVPTDYKYEGIEFM